MYPGRKRLPSVAVNLTAIMALYVGYDEQVREVMKLNNIAEQLKEQHPGEWGRLQQELVRQTRIKQMQADLAKDGNLAHAFLDTYAKLADKLELILSQ